MWLVMSGSSFFLVGLVALTTGSAATATTTLTQHRSDTAAAFVVVGPPPLWSSSSKGSRVTHLFPLTRIPVGGRSMVFQINNHHNKDNNNNNDRGGDEGHDAVENNDDEGDKVKVGSKEYLEGFISSPILDDSVAERGNGLEQALKLGGSVAAGLLVLFLGFMASNGLL